MASSRFWLPAALVVATAFPLLAAEKVFQGELTDRDPIHAEREAPVDRYEIEAEAGSLMTVALKSDESTAFDEYLIVSGPMGEEFTNDDADEGSQVMMIVPTGGTWDIEVTGFGKDTRGRYEVRVTTEKLERVLAERGDLSTEDERLPKQGEFFDTYPLQFEAGAQYVLLASSTEFQPFLSVHHPDGLATSDKCPQSSYERAIVILTASSAGEGKVLVTSGPADATGRYRLFVSKVVEGKPQETPRQQPPGSRVN